LCKIETIWGKIETIWGTSRRRRVKGEVDGVVVVGLSKSTLYACKDIKY
jgi:hypothetical protein